MEITNLRQSRETGRVAYLRFMQSYHRFPERLFCFFEGEDAKYYNLTIEQYYGPFINLPCGGKREVIRARELVRQARLYDGVRKAFFIDQDFDGFLFEGDNEVFETTVYSIENYYITDHVLTRILEVEFQIPADDADLESAVRLYNALKTQFFEKVMLLNAWIFFQRKSRGSGF
jgi:hypothetical protein